MFSTSTNHIGYIVQLFTLLQSAKADVMFSEDKVIHFILGFLVTCTGLLRLTRRWGVVSVTYFIQFGTSIVYIIFQQHSSLLLFIVSTYIVR